MPLLSRGSAQQREVRRGSFLGAVIGIVRIVHPFPSGLDGLVAGAMALVAGGTVPLALQLGLAMFSLQAAIGTANDLIDEDVDRGRKTGKPLPRGLLTPAAARMLLAVAVAAGLGLSAIAGTLVFAVALVVLGVGFAYDLRLKGTVWSWLPFAVGIPLLPVFAWLGATGSLPRSFLVLIPTAILAGAALALANLLADIERDTAAGAETAATRLGLRRTWLLAAVLQASVIALAVVSLVSFRGRGAGVIVVAVGAMVVAAGVGLGRGGPARAREWAWELEATGVGLMGAGWLAAVAEARAL